jgi:hypothetical protein
MGYLYGIGHCHLPPVLSLGEVMPVKTPQFIATKPDDNGNPVGGGYQCTVCGLTTLINGEPHISSAGKVCFPAPAGQPILVKGGMKGEVIRHPAPVVETVETIHKEMEQLGEGFKERIKAAEARQHAADEALAATHAAEAAAAPVLTPEEIQAARLADATAKRDAALAAKKAAS